MKNRIKLILLTLLGVFAVGCASKSSPLAYIYSGPESGYAIVESKFERISPLNWVKYNLHAVDGKFTEPDNFYGITIPTKIISGEHAVQLRIIALVTEGLTPVAHTANVNFDYQFMPMKYKINGSVHEQKVWLETEDGRMVTSKMSIKFSE